MDKRSQFFQIADELVTTTETGPGDNKLVASEGLEPPEGRHLRHGVSSDEEDQRDLTAGVSWLMCFCSLLIVIVSPC